MRVHSSLRLSIFDFSSLIEAVSVCPKVPMHFIQVDGHRESQNTKHRSQHNFAQFSSFTCILSQISQFLVTFAVSFTSLDPA